MPQVRCARCLPVIRRCCHVIRLRVALCHVIICISSSCFSNLHPVFFPVVRFTFRHSHTRPWHPSDLVSRVALKMFLERDETWHAVLF